MEGHNRPFNEDELDRLQRAESESAPDEDAATSDSAFRRLLGLVTLSDLDVLGKLAVLEQMLGRERDRVLAQFERRRRERIREALHTATIAAPVVDSR